MNIKQMIEAYQERVGQYSVAIFKTPHERFLSLGVMLSLQTDPEENRV